MNHRFRIRNIKQGLIFFIFLTYILSARAQQITFNHWGVESGLSQNSVFSIAQDDKGFMWYGTSYGLNRFDGHNFKTYLWDSKDSTSLSDNSVGALLYDSHQTLWVGTDNKLNKYNAEKNYFERITLSQQNLGNNSSNIIKCLFEDSKKNIWVGTTDGLFLLTDRQFNRFKRFGNYETGGIAANNIRCIYEDNEHRLWIGTTKGLTSISLLNGAYFYKTYLHDVNNPKSLSDNYITSITEDNQKNLWVGTQNQGLNLFDKSAQTFTRFLYSPGNSSGIINNNIRKLITDKAGKLWIGTQEGLSVMAPFSHQCISYQYDPSNKQSISQNSVHSIFEDANASIWVGTFFGGINLAYLYTASFNTWQNSKAKPGISNNVISSIITDDKNNLWIATEGGGLNFYNRATQQFTTYKNNINDSASLGSNLVKKIYKDKLGNIWVGTHAGGLNLFNPATNKFKRFFFYGNEPGFQLSEIAAILEDSKNNLWVGTQGTIKHLKVYRSIENNLLDITANYILNAVAGKDIKVIFEDSKKKIWAGTSSGLYLLKEGSTSFTTVSVKTGSNDLASAFITCIQEDRKGNIWIGAENGGLRKYDTETQELITLTQKDGLPHNNILGILEDDKAALWVSTGNGLARFDPATNTFRVYTTSDGLPGNEFNYNSYFKSPTGEIFFGGYNGFISFFPDKIKANTYSSTVAFTGLKLFGQPVSINDESGLLKQDINFCKSITLNYNQNVFTIDFALLNFIRAEKNKYAYKLEGFDKGWNEISSTSATYMNLPPGKYTLMVKGANNDGVWSEPKQIKILILPPFWKTWWAYLLYALALAAILFFAFRFIYLRALLKSEDKLHQVKLNFFTNISHEIRTHLTLIMAPVDKMLEDNKADKFLNQQLGNVKNNTNRLLKLVSELMDFRKAETNHLNLTISQNNIIPFLQDIYSSFQELSLAKNIKTSFIHDTDNAPVYFDKEQLEKVFFNLLTNAFKFTPEGGQIYMNVEQNDNKVYINVIDNGRGIAPQFLEKLFSNFFQVADHGLQNTGYGIGLALSKNIVELHKGNIEVKSEPASAGKDGRTCFTVTLLKGNRHFEGTTHILQPKIIQKNILQEPEIAQQPATALNAEIKDKQYTIQVTEDNDELRALIKETFEHQYNIIECNNGRQGWEAASEQIPDLIISDVMMPEMDGFELCKKLKTDERTSHIPVILLTAKSAQNDQISGLETGADVYITKPFSTKILELNVHNLLTSREKIRQRFSNQITTTAPTADETTIKTVEGSFVNKIDKEFLEKVIQIIEEYMDEPEFGVPMLSRKVAMSQPVLYKKLKAVTNMSVNDFIKSLRLKKAAQLLFQKEMTVVDVANAVGFNDRKHFSQEFKKQFGKTPSEFKMTI